MKITAEPRSDQYNAEDFIGGPRVFTVDHVRPGTAEQKYDIVLQGEQRVWRPPLTVLRTLMACWGDDSTVWQGRQVELYTDPSVSFGKDRVGGIRIKALSHLENPQTVMVTEARGRRKKITVEPLQAAPPTDWQALLQDAQGDRDKLLTLHTRATNESAPQDILDAIIQAGQQATQPEGEQK